MYNKFQKKVKFRESLYIYHTNVDPAITSLYEGNKFSS